MHADAQGSLQVDVRLDGFLWIHVNRLHEPARFVGTDGKHRDVDCSAPLPDHAKVAAVAGVEVLLVSALQATAASRKKKALRMVSLG